MALQSKTRPANASTRSIRSGAKIRHEAEDIVRREPELASFIYENILHHDTLETAVAHRVSQRLEHADVSSDLIRQALSAMRSRTHPSLGESVPRRHRRDVRPRSGDHALHRAGAVLQRLPRHSDPPAGALAAAARAARTSRCTCRAARRRCSSATSIRPPRSAAASSSITPPAWWSARPR